MELQKFLAILTRWEVFSNTSHRIQEWYKWVHPSNDQLYDAGDYADLWSRDDREYLNVNADNGNVNYTDNPTNGHSVRSLNTMHLSDIFQAYFDCRRRKRRTCDALQFEEQYEKHCLRLHHEIISCTYKPDNYQLIYVTDPVMREIFVPTFRDRVIHNLLANWLRPKLEKIFIYDNYAGREGRGTLFGIRRAEKFMRQVTHNYQKPAFILKLDIASYFRSIPKERLVSVILGQVNPFAEQGMNVTRVSSRNTLRKANRIIFVLLTAKVRKTAESK